MRAREFLAEADDKTVTINIPITITIPGGSGSPSVSTAAPADPTDLPDQPVNVFPLQQQLELLKQQGGKKSKVINQIISDNGASSEEDSKKEYDVAEDFEHLKGIFEELNPKD